MSLSPEERQKIAESELLRIETRRSESLGRKLGRIKLFGIVVGIWAVAVIVALALEHFHLIK